MASIFPGYEYDIFISYRQKDNKHDGWVTEFVRQLKGELESTFKEEISVYFDINPHDGLLETHDVEASLKEKLKCLIFIPIISRTYCDPKSFAWKHEFKAFVEEASMDPFGLKVKLPNGNVTSRVLPIRIHDLDNDDINLCESVLGSMLRGIEFIYKESGVNRPLRANEENPHDNLNHTLYRNQINKVANTLKDIISSVGQYSPEHDELLKKVFKPVSVTRKNNKSLVVIAVSVIAFILVVLGFFFKPKLFQSKEKLEESIAVLPFINLSNDPEQEYFSDGMVDAILDHLFKAGNFLVISRTSSLRYKNTKLTLKEIAHELGVSTLLEGSVQRTGNKVRITAQLIEPKTGFHLWSESYERDLSDIFSVQSEVAQNVANELKETLKGKEIDLIKKTSHTPNQLAYDFYLKGNDYWSKYETIIAIDMYSKAIQEDSLYAEAYSQRAKMYSYNSWIMSEGLANNVLKAKEDIKKGILLNPELLEVKLAQAIGYYFLDRDYNNALKILKELKTIAPNMAESYAFTSYILRRQGKLKESIREAKLSLKMDPFNANYIDNLSYTYELLHQYDNQIECCRNGLSLIPDHKNFNYAIFYSWLNKTSDLNVALKESGLKEVNLQFQVYYYSRQFDKLIDFIRNSDLKLNIEGSSIQMYSDEFIYHPKTYESALMNYLNGNKSLCKIYADSTISLLTQKLKEVPTDDRIYSTLGKCYAFCGNANEAIAILKKAVLMMPIKLDFIRGVAKEQDLMEIYIFTGNFDDALDKIEYLLSNPSWLSVGKLKTDPIFDALRGLQRFKKIISSDHR